MTLVKFLPKTEAGKYTETWRPAADITETDEGFTIVLDVPGFSKDDLSVKAYDGQLTVSGERERTEAQDTKLYRHYERPAGKFERSFRLPDYIESESIKGAFENGTLTLELKKKEEAKPHTVTIK